MNVLKLQVKANYSQEEKLTFKMNKIKLQLKLKMSPSKNKIKI